LLPQKVDGTFICRRLGRNGKVHRRPMWSNPSAKNPPAMPSSDRYSSERARPRRQSTTPAKPSYRFPRAWECEVPVDHSAATPMSLSCDVGTQDRSGMWDIAHSRELHRILDSKQESPRPCGTHQEVAPSTDRQGYRSTLCRQWEH